MKYTIFLIANYLITTWANPVFALQNGCTAQSGASQALVIELYTSEGCSSCPPADKWLSSLKAPGSVKAAAADKATAAGAGNVAGNLVGNAAASVPVNSTTSGAVVQAFHVGYWDYIGWVDRFASPAHTTRQRQIANFGGQSTIYTPQAVLNGRDWRNWGRLPSSKEPAGAHISLRQIGEDQFEATVTPVTPVTTLSTPLAPGTAGASGTWSAYWTVTEHGHSSKVKSGENAGEFLQHDFVVRQYTPVGDYPADAKTPQKLVWRSIAATPGHPRQINLIVFDKKTGKTLQAVSASC